MQTRETSGPRPASFASSLCASAGLWTIRVVRAWTIVRATAPRSDKRLDAAAKCDLGDRAHRDRIPALRRDRLHLRPHQTVPCRVVASSAKGSLTRKNLFHFA